MGLDVMQMMTSKMDPQEMRQHLTLVIGGKGWKQVLTTGITNRSEKVTAEELLPALEVIESLHARARSDQCLLLQKHPIQHLQSHDVIHQRILAHQ